MDPSSTQVTIAKAVVEAGWTMVPIYLCSIAALGIFLRKLYELSRARVGRVALLDDPTIDANARAGELEAIVERARADESALGDAMAFAARVLIDNPERAEEETVRISERLVGDLTEGIGALGFIAQVAPLLGLFGTVVGMVELFSAMETAGTNVDTSVLSAGIWKALITTAAGLSVGIPTLAAHAWLSARIERLRRDIEDGTSAIINAVPRGAQRGG